ncbi:hypothetical protein EYZ11_008799 [Aspergillus tanneri]|uniref:Uncharacterized protein n=1 Tax=Aspergillus tanneri TaxID=1220188 RepID=A0A4S3JBR0_9EURO|nr:uncharacterized protein ATNIH1004_005745 [Aspergillus tanneri]KAA8647062.1 hypothetical protein ATNIH1004_005745 [Aspergillus tanneri]THC91748.1 hypothetical protein EYZ11_008799 [Aspergillus tanneri]
MAEFPKSLIELVLAAQEEPEKHPYGNPTSWPAAKIHGFVNYVLEHLEQFAPKDQTKQQALKEVQTAMNVLWPPTGEKYELPKPKQIIARKLERPKGGPKELIVDPNNTYKDTSYWNLWSHLGVFLGLLGPAPPNSEVANFYAPMTAMWGWWCISLLEADKTSLSKFAMTQCTWYRNPGKQDEFLLGHSLGGHEPKAADRWEEKVQRARYNLIKDPFSLEENEWSFECSPLTKANGASDTKFGNCAETYPFTTFFWKWELSPTQKEQLYGLALRRDYFPPRPKDVAKITRNKFNIRMANQHMVPPCENCAELIRLGQGDKLKFDPVVIPQTE